MSVLFDIRFTNRAMGRIETDVIILNNGEVYYFEGPPFDLSLMDKLQRGHHVARIDDVEYWRRQLHRAIDGGWITQPRQGFDMGVTTYTGYDGARLVKLATAGDAVGHNDRAIELVRFLSNLRRSVHTAIAE
jgi:hypothetical protein